MIIPNHLKYKGLYFVIIIFVNLLILHYLHTNRLEIDINNSNIPTKASAASKPDMASNKFIKFTHSSIYHDVAQTTLPFIDIQPVTPSKGIPLSGVGIYFKGSNNYAGFIGTSIFTYNFTDYLNLNLLSNL